MCPPSTTSHALWAHVADIWEWNCMKMNVPKHTPVKNLEKHLSDRMQPPPGRVAKSLAPFSFTSLSTSIGHIPNKIKKSHDLIRQGSHYFSLSRKLATLDIPIASSLSIINHKPSALPIINLPYELFSLWNNKKLAGLSHLKIIKKIVRGITLRPRAFSLCTSSKLLCLVRTLTTPHTTGQDVPWVSLSGHLKPVGIEGEFTMQTSVRTMACPLQGFEELAVEWQKVWGPVHYSVRISVMYDWKGFVF